MRSITCSRFSAIDSARLAGVALEGGNLAWRWRCAALEGVLFATLPVASQMLARVAAVGMLGASTLTSGSCEKDRLGAGDGS